MEILVFGAGSLGSLVGGLLARTHDVTLVGRDPHMRRVEADGLAITGLRDDRVYPRARTDAIGTRSDLALVTVKSYDTDDAASALAGGDHGAVCSLQNGLGNEDRLAAVLSCPILGGSATYGADLVEPGVVRMTGVGTVTLGLFRGGDGGLLDRVSGAFEAADLAVETTPDVRERLWHKLAVNAAINPLTALARVRNAAVGEEPLRGVARAAADEVVAVAEAEGVDLDGDAVRSAVFEVARATGENRSSMLQDVLEGRRTEIEAINGAVVERAGAAPVPVNAALAALIGGWERDRDLRPTD